MIDWNKELENPPKLFSKRYYELACAADKWVTCAVGNQCKIIPRYDSGEPKDFRLRTLGIKFSDHIDAADFKTAKEVLEKIENRSGELIKEIKDENI